MLKATIIGNLTRDPEQRTAQSGTSMVRFTVAVNRRRKLDNQPDVDFCNITCFGKTGELAMQYLSKGRKVCIIGNLTVNTFTGQDGQTRHSIDVVCDDLEFLPSAPQNQGDSSSYSKPQNAKPAQNNSFAGFNEMDEDELPF